MIFYRSLKHFLLWFSLYMMVFHHPFKCAWGLFRSGGNIELYEKVTLMVGFRHEARRCTQIMMLCVRSDGSKLKEMSVSDTRTSSFGDWKPKDLSML